MTARDKLQLSYELAFFPPRLNRLWEAFRRDAALPAGDAEALDDAARLHLALPSGGYASQRALERLALYQARSRAYGMPLFIRAVRSRLGRPAVEDAEVPGRLVRDVALPELARPRHNERGRQEVLAVNRM
jgi:hypothetical protein